MAVPDSTAERILQAVRAWLKLAAARTPLTDAQVTALGRISREILRTTSPDVSAEVAQRI